MIKEKLLELVETKYLKLRVEQNVPVTEHEKQAGKVEIRSNQTKALIEVIAPMLPDLPKKD